MAQEDRSSLISRIGTFFILIGLFAIILFVASDIAQKTNLWFFLIALFMLVTGGVFKRAGAVPSIPDKRFEGIRKWQQARREASSKKSMKNKK